MIKCGKVKNFNFYFFSWKFYLIVKIICLKCDVLSVCVIFIK